MAARGEIMEAAPETRVVMLMDSTGERPASGCLRTPTPSAGTATRTRVVAERRPRKADAYERSPAPIRKQHNVALGQAFHSMVVVGVQILTHGFSASLLIE